MTNRKATRLTTTKILNHLTHEQSKQPSTTVEDSDNEETPAVAEPTPNQSQNQSQNQPLLKGRQETIVSAPDPVVATPEPEVKATAPPVLKKKIIREVAQPTA
jgi:hypothetical protein